MAEQKLRRIISDGQAGVDRAILDVAKVYGVSSGGWCPKSGMAEDGHISSSYHLRSTASESPCVRVQRNIHESDATLLITFGTTSELAHKITTLSEEASHPILHIDMARMVDTAMVEEWLTEHKVNVLYVVGTNESSAPGIYRRTRKFFNHLFEEMEKHQHLVVHHSQPH